MPAVSQKQQRLMGMAEHQPEKVRKSNRGVLNMSHQQLHDFAATKGLGKQSRQSQQSRKGGHS